MKKTNGANRRSNYFINKPFQTMFIIKFCVLVVIATLIFSFMIYRFSTDSVTTVFENSRLQIKPSTQFIMPALIAGGFLSVILVGIATIIVVLFMSHRIAGPLYKLEKSIVRLGEGDLSFYVDFRAGDEMKKLAEAFNMTSRRLNTLLLEMKTNIREVAAICAELKDVANKNQVKGLGEIVEKIEKTSNQLIENIHKFNLRV
ncbi:MAG: methyl-accepting chemotaxis protein [Candidatus Omnitrophica bacterium]|nr:methyl-accepting chemotaxis protein [Candidatus Omnitrophota bacterium]